MIDVTDIRDLRGWVREQRAAGRRIGFVPTMGYFHEGHLRLIDEARRVADVVVVSVFVNPLQFGSSDDLARYPRDLDRDRKLAAERGADLLFAPTVEDMYPPGDETRVVPGDTAARWEGAARPGHFEGVLTVVAKLFNMVGPDVACFGRKDLQQVTLIRQMVRDLAWPIEIVVVPTVRESDGLALSSRNVHLSPTDRHDALALSGALRAAYEAFQAGETRAAALESRVRGVLELHPRVGVEYIAVTEPDRLEPVATVNERTAIALAARVGTTRLIDNIILGKGLG